MPYPRRLRSFRSRLNMPVSGYREVQRTTDTDTNLPPISGSQPQVCIYDTGIEGYDTGRYE